MSGVTILWLFCLAMYLVCIDWKALGGVLRDGGWFAVLFYVVLGIVLVQVVTGAIS